MPKKAKKAKSPTKGAFSVKVLVKGLHTAAGTIAGLDWALIDGERTDPVKTAAMLHAAADLLAKSVAPLMSVQEELPRPEHDRHVFAVRMPVIVDPRRYSVDEIGRIVATACVRAGMPVVDGYEWAVENLTVARRPARGTNAFYGCFGYKNKKMPTKGLLPVFVLETSAGRKVSKKKRA